MDAAEYGTPEDDPFFDDEEGVKIVRALSDYVEDELLEFWPNYALDFSQALEPRYYGKIAKSERLLNQLMQNLESDATIWRSRSHDLIDQWLDQNSELMAGKESGTYRDDIAERVFVSTLGGIEGELDKLRTLIDKTRVEIEKWGAVMPVEARYEELVKVRRSYNKKAYKYSAWAVVTASIIGIWLYNYSVWLVVVPALACLYVIRLVWGQTLLITGQLAWGDKELEAWAKENNKTV